MTSPRTAERRSPSALAHDPPVTKHEWTVLQDQPLDAFLEDARARAGLDDEGVDRLLRHAGIHLDRRRLELDCDPPKSVPAGTSVALYSFVHEPQSLTLPAQAVLLDESGVLAIAKPPFFTVQGTRASRLCSLERAVRERTGQAGAVPAHRLDRETSGLVLFAATRAAASLLGRQFLARTVRKEYLALVHPPPVETTFEVSGRMARVLHPAHSLFGLLPAETPGGQDSRTRFVVREVRGRRALVRCEPHTGRTHQLRVHLAARGTPIVGDSLYGTGWRSGDPGSAERLLLHAHALELKLAQAGPVTRLEAPVPPDLAA